MNAVLSFDVLGLAPPGRGGGPSGAGLWRALAVLFVAMAVALASRAVQARDASLAVQSLHARLVSLQAEFDNNPFRRPIHLESSERADSLAGEILSVVDYPFAIVSAALVSPVNWCDILLLHFNIKYCDSSVSAGRASLVVGLGKKFEQPASEAYPIHFIFHPRVEDDAYFSIELAANSGPFGTRDYRFEIEAIPAASGRTLIHLRYAYAFGLSGRLAVRGYLATSGRDKRGFTVTGRGADGEPVYIQGLRGVIERNTMRYCLAIEAWLAGADAVPAERLETRLHYWYASTEQYARQLHEMSLDEYLASKRHEFSQHLGK